MTTYRQRHEAGTYTLGNVKTEKQEPQTAAEPEATPAEANPLDSMTKAELLEHAQQLGVSPANNDMTKQEIRDGIEQKLANA